MDKYYEQSVAAKFSARNRILFAVCVAAIMILLLAAMILGAGILGSDPSVIEIHWLNAIGCALALLAVVFLFRWKDTLRMGYDYILQENELEIYGIMNERRRKRLGRIDLNRVLEAGPVCSMPSGDRAPRFARWYADESRYYMIYMEENIRRGVLLELDEKMAGQIRGRVPAGAWRGEEGKI